MSNGKLAEVVVEKPTSWPVAQNQPVPVCRNLIIATAVLILCFAIPLYKWMTFALQNSLYSHILLIPWISLYLAWPKRTALLHPSFPAVRTAIGFALAGLLGVAAYWGFMRRRGFALENELALLSLSFLLLFIGACCWFLGGKTLRPFLFPLGFLFFAIPFPTAMESAIESFLQQYSASAADLLFGISGAPYLRDGLVFHLPDINLRVAPECSGIHSSLVLLITSTIAGYLFLQSPWRRAALAVAVIPLAILRNGFRIAVIGQLCIHLGPQMIDSPVHHHGGPLFFALSLIPFFLFLVFLIRSERKKAKFQKA